MPHYVIYLADDVVPLILGDFDADSDVDLIDFQWFQTCYTGPDTVDPLGQGCAALDFDADQDIDRSDLAAFYEAAAPPG